MKKVFLTLTLILATTLTFATLSTNKAISEQVRWETTFTSSCGVTTTIYASSAQEMYDNMIGFEEWSCY